MNHIVAAIAYCVVGVFAIVGLVGALIVDARPFSEVVVQCRDQGYIQNKTVRVLCVVEGE